MTMNIDFKSKVRMMDCNRAGNHSKYFRFKLLMKCYEILIKVFRLYYTHQSVICKCTVTDNDLAGDSERSLDYFDLQIIGS